jgi:hypothetical protein
MKTIDTSKPWIPDNFTLAENKSLGKIKWDKKKVSLWLSQEQEKGYIYGETLKNKVKNPLNSTVLKFLLDNPTEIPNEWKNKYIYFWGTILQNPNGVRFVLYLFWGDGEWDWMYDWLDSDWGVDNPSAVLASPLDLETEPYSETLPLELNINGITYIKK